MDNEKPMIQLCYQLLIKCPQCGADFDLCDNGHNDDSKYSRPIFNNDWDVLDGETVICEQCDLEFEIGGCEY